jgi:hypothetical protein
MRLPGHERRLALLAGLAAAGALSLAPPASADVGHTIVGRCVHGESLSGFSPSAYGKALKELSATTEEYSDCASLIRQAQRAAASGHGGSSSNPVSAAPPTQIAATPAEQNQIAGAVRTGAQPLEVGGQLIHPGVVHGNVASAFSTLPSPLLAVLGFLLGCLVLLAGAALRNRNRDSRID